MIALHSEPDDFEKRDARLHDRVWKLGHDITLFNEQSSAHHLGRRLLVEVGLQPAEWRANVHQRVLNELHQQYVTTGRMTAEAWRALNQLRDLRQTADYELATRARLRHVNRAVSLFTQFSEECYQILGV